MVLLVHFAEISGNCKMIISFPFMGRLTIRIYTTFSRSSSPLSSPAEGGRQLFQGKGRGIHQLERTMKSSWSSSSTHVQHSVHSYHSTVSGHIIAAPMCTTPPASQPIPLIQSNPTTPELLSSVKPMVKNAMKIRYNPLLLSPYMKPKFFRKVLLTAGIGCHQQSSYPNKMQAKRAM